MTKKEKTRNEILSVSKELFISKGYKDTLIIDIAKKVAVDRRTIYRHFESKEVILVTIIEAMYEDFGTYLNTIVFTDNLTSFEKIVELLDKYSFYFLNHVDILIITSMLDNNLSNETRNIKSYKEFVKKTQIPDEILLQLLKSGVTDHSIISAIDLETTTVTINNSLLSLASRVVGHKDILDIEQGLESWKMVFSLADLLLRGIKND